MANRKPVKHGHDETRDHPADEHGNNGHKEESGEHSLPLGWMEKLTTTPHGNLMTKESQWS